MITKTAISAAEMQALLAAVFEYNKRGVPEALVFYNSDGIPLPVAWIEVACADAGLAVRTQPELTPMEAAARVTDARTILPPASMEELATAVGE